MDKFIENVNGDIIKEKVFDIFRGTVKFSLLALVVSKKIGLEKDNDIINLDEKIMEVVDSYYFFIDNWFEEIEDVVERILCEIDENKKNSFH